ncbi:hypothetical protein VVD49_20425 [Uliginosibacterium sp. H3]|uniref:Uncharacterized protein n=1 Tax=Uliginosibacterium silvisoli TaxID=3114758 RepID=A0ABU6K8T9_9RHOO|nr:hypothetical protein [Uliginosibacterium sp. H3]
MSTLNSFGLQKAMQKKIKGQIEAAPMRGKSETVDKREQRKRDQEQGLIPFACKLPSALVEQVREQAAAHEGGINGLVAELLAKALTK